MIDLLKSGENSTVPTPKKKGGARPGAGRKPLPTFEARELFKKAFDKHFTEQEWDELVAKYKGDKDMMKYLIDQRLGKASQAVEVSGSEGGPVKISIVDFATTKPEDN